MGSSIQKRVKDIKEVAKLGSELTKMRLDAGADLRDVANSKAKKLVKSLKRTNRGTRKPSGDSKSTKSTLNFY